MAASKRYHLNKEDLNKIGRGCLIAAGGAVITYLLELLPSVDLGTWTPTVVALASIGLNALRKWLSGKK